MRARLAVCLGVAAALAGGPAPSSEDDRETVSGGPSGPFGRRTLCSWAGEPAPADPLEPTFFSRPGFTNPAKSLARGHVAVETGYTFIYNDDPDGRSMTSSFPEAVVRAGLFADWLEFDVGGNFTDTTANAFGGTATGASGLNDLYVGAVIALTPQAGWLPETAVVPQTTLPTGSKEVSSRHLQPGVGYLYNWDIGEGFCFGGGTQLNRRAADGDVRYLELTQSICAGWNVTDRLSSYGEWFAFFPTGESDGAAAEHYFDTGVALLVRRNVQWDLQLGFGLNGPADDLFAGTGVSFGF